MVFRGCFVTEETTLGEASAIAARKSLAEAFRVVDGIHEGEIMTLNDVPVQFGTRKKYRERRVTIIYNDHEHQ